MIKQIIDLLASSEFYGCSETIEIAKGKYKMPESWKEGKKQIKRSYKWQLRKQ